MLKKLTIVLCLSAVAGSVKSMDLSNNKTAVYESYGPAWNPHAAKEDAASASADDLRGVDVCLMQLPHSFFSRAYSFRLELTNRSSQRRQIRFQFSHHVNRETLPVRFSIVNREDTVAVIEENLPTVGMKTGNYAVSSSWILTLAPGETWSREWTWKPFLWPWWKNHQAQVELMLDPRYRSFMPDLPAQSRIQLPLKVSGSTEVRLPFSR